MVASLTTGLDVASFSVSVALPGALWASLFLLAWNHGPFAESVGLGRRSFWLLVPGALLASFALLPIAPVSYDWVAVGLAGAVFPLLVGGIALGRYAPPLGRSLGTFLGLVAAMSGALFVIVLPTSAPALDRWGKVVGLPANGVAVLLVAVVASAVVAIVAALAVRSTDRSVRSVAFLVALVSFVLVLTFAGSSAIPGVGIAEAFPFYLAPPILAGFVAGVAAPRVFPREEGFALPVAFFASTFGVLLGADLLREPPLYGHGPAGLYTIGGAGIFDLVYLSGLLALATAYLTHALRKRSWSPIGSPLPEPSPTSIGYLDRAYRSGFDGQLEASIRESYRASHEAADQARRLLGAGASPDGRPWQGLPVPGWVVSDQANLDAVSTSGTRDVREAYRAWLTARNLVLVGRRVGLARFASIPQRVLAFAIDLALLGGAGCAVFAFLAFRTPGGFADLLSSLAFNAAIYGFVAVGIFYFALTEAWTGTTVGKAAVGISVRDRDLRVPTGMAALVRNASNAPILLFLGVGAAIAVAIALKGIPGGQAAVLGIGIPLGTVAILGIAGVVIGAASLLGAFAVVVIVLTWERQRVGDLWAGTWVVRRPTVPRPVPLGSTSGSASGSAGSGPSG